jgi:hypothetical protein
MIISEFDHFKNIALGGLDWDTDTLKLALFTSSLTVNTANTGYADLTGEVSDASYTAGGNTVANAAIASGAVTADPVTWTALTAVFRYAVLYVSGTVANVTDPLLLIYDFEADVTVSGIDWTLSWQDGKIYQLTNPV